MRKSPKAGFDSSYDYRHILITSSNQISVDNGCIIRALSHGPAGCVGIRRTFLFRYIVVIYHGIHVSAGNQKAKPRPSKHINTVRIFPVRLRDNSHLIASGFQNPADDGMPKRGMIHIRIPDHIDKIQLVNSPFLHVLS